jgi:peroxiredoxin
MSLRQTLSKLPDPVKTTIQERAYPKLLAEGETAPEWHLQASDDSWHRQGKSWSVMFFFVDGEQDPDRSELLSFQKNLPEFTRLGAKVFAITNKETWTNADLVKDLGLGFPVLTDRGGPVARLFKACLQLPLRPMYLRAVYLVNPERKIRLANRGTPSVEAIVRSVEALQKATKAGM